MHTFGKDKLITPWTIRKRVQESYAWKQTKLKIRMHLLQKILLDNIWFGHGFPTFTYTQKGRQPYLFKLFKFYADSFAHILAKLKIQEFVITHLQR